MIVLKRAKTIENNIKEQLIEFLGTIGRINDLRAIYPAFYKRDKEEDLTTFEKYRSFYHPLVFKYIVLALRALK